MNPSADMPRDFRVRDLVFPVRIVQSEGAIDRLECLTASRTLHSAVDHAPGALFHPGSAVILDFGRELSGGVRIVTGRFPESETGKTRRVRLRFGESVSEVCGHPDYGHTVMDSEVLLATLGAQEFGQTGFRFVRLDFYAETELLGVQAVFLHYDFPRNEFTCSDPLVNRIWQTGADTLEMCCQDLVWDGVKRDRLAWMGDLYLELLAGQVCFGRREIFERTLDFLRDGTRPPRMMNGSVTYSIYWLLAQCARFRFDGGTDWPTEQRDYLTGLLTRLLPMVPEDGDAILSGGWQLLDWATGCDASEETIRSIYAGGRALLKLALDACPALLTEWGEDALAVRCRETAERLKRRTSPLTSSKSCLALLTLAGLRDAAETAPLLYGDGSGAGFSTFHGGFMLEALSRAGRTADALNIVRNYWGGMLTLGATSFWEHFDVRWLDRAARIDEIVPADQNDVHKNCGEGCFTGFRHSLCHGWGASVNVWLSERILGIRQMSGREIVLDPQPCGLAYAAGTYRTAAGILRVEVTDGRCVYEAPDGLKIRNLQS